jgi:hypothetical protein
LMAAAYMAILPDRKAATQHERDGRQVGNQRFSRWIPHRRAGPTLHALTTMANVLHGLPSGCDRQVSHQAEVCDRTDTRVVRLPPHLLLRMGSPLAGRCPKGVAPPGPSSGSLSTRNGRCRGMRRKKLPNALSRRVDMAGTNSFRPLDTGRAGALSPPGQRNRPVRVLVQVSKTRRARREVDPCEHLVGLCQVGARGRP